MCRSTGRDFSKKVTVCRSTGRDVSKKEVMVCRSTGLDVSKKKYISCPWPELKHESADVRSVYPPRHSGSANYIYSVLKLLYLANDGTGCVK